MNWSKGNISMSVLFWGKNNWFKKSSLLFQLCWVFMLSPNFTTSWLHFQEKFSETVKFHFNHFILLDKIQSDKAKADIFWIISYKGDGRSVLNAKNYPKGLSLKPPILLMQFHENSSASKDWYWSAIPFCAFFNHINSKYRIRKDG